MDGRTGFDPLRYIDDMAALISDVTGETVTSVIDRLEQERLHPGSTVANEFDKHGGPRYQWGPHLEAFYSSTNAFLYELAVWNRNRLKATMRRWTTRHLARQGRPLEVLGIGDGLGFDCLHLARNRHRVTYFELPGASEQFARKLFERTGNPIQMLTDPAAIGPEAFDAVICFDVLEHVPDPPAIVKTLASCLRTGGSLYVSAPFYMILPWYPTHLRANRRFSGRLDLYHQAGLELVDGRMTWYPIVLRKLVSALPPPLSIRTVGLRLSGAVQKIGQVAAWPFVPVHLLRGACNRRFRERSVARSAAIAELK